MPQGDLFLDRDLSDAVIRDVIQWLRTPERLLTCPGVQRDARRDGRAALRDVEAELDRIQQGVESGFHTPEYYDYQVAERLHPVIARYRVAYEVYRQRADAILNA